MAPFSTGCYAILDLGCGPGRDLHYFRSLGHGAVGLDGSMKFVAMARRYSGCDVLHQDFLAMNLPVNRFDGIFANASLFHVPSQELSRVLAELAESLKPRGVLFCSNPRGNNEEGVSGERYSCFFDLTTWRDFVTAAGFMEVKHYYRPPGGATVADFWRDQHGATAAEYALLLGILATGMTISLFALSDSIGGAMNNISLTRSLRAAAIIKARALVSAAVRAAEAVKAVARARETRAKLFLLPDAKL
jgi:SAM-dependent methyltransferase